MARSNKKILGDETTHYVPARKKRGRPKVKLQPPLTPMIDVTFQLLIFFVIAAQFRQLEGQIPGTLPARGSGSAAEMKDYIPVRIHLMPYTDPDTKAVTCIYKMNGKLVAGPGELYGKLMGYKKTTETDEIPIEIRPTGAVPWRFILEAKNAGVRAEYKNIGYTY